MQQPSPGGGGGACGGGSGSAYAARAVSHAPSLDEGCDDVGADAWLSYRSFACKLMMRMKECAASAGGENARNVAARYDAKRNMGLYNDGALDSRYALGASSSAYLMATVLPLHAISDDTASSIYPAGLYPEVDAAGQVAVLHALKDEVNRQQEGGLEDVGAVLSLLCWILQLQEIKDFFVARLSGDCPPDHAADALDIVNKASDLREIKKTLAKRATLAAVALLFNDMLYLLGDPVERSERQEVTTTQDSMRRLHSNLGRLAQCVGHLQFLRRAVREQRQQFFEQATIRHRGASIPRPVQFGAPLTHRDILECFVMPELVEQHGASIGGGNPGFPLAANALTVLLSYWRGGPLSQNIQNTFGTRQLESQPIFNEATQDQIYAAGMGALSQANSTGTREDLYRLWWISHTQLADLLQATYFLPPAQAMAVQQGFVQYAGRILPQWDNLPDTNALPPGFAEYANERLELRRRAVESIEPYLRSRSNANAETDKQLFAGFVKYMVAKFNIDTTTAAQVTYWLYFRCRAIVDEGVSPAVVLLPDGAFEEARGSAGAMWSFERGDSSDDSIKETTEPEDVFTPPAPPQPPTSPPAPPQPPPIRPHFTVNEIFRFTPKDVLNTIGLQRNEGGTVLDEKNASWVPTGDITWQRQSAYDSIVGLLSFGGFKATKQHDQPPETWPATSEAQAIFEKASMGQGAVTVEEVEKYRRLTLRDLTADLKQPIREIDIDDVLTAARGAARPLVLPHATVDAYYKQKGRSILDDAPDLPGTGGSPETDGPPETGGSPETERRWGILKDVFSTAPGIFASIGIALRLAFGRRFGLPTPSDTGGGGNPPGEAGKSGNPPGDAGGGGNPPGGSGSSEVESVRVLLNGALGDICMDPQPIRNDQDELRAAQGLAAAAQQLQECNGRHEVSATMSGVTRHSNLSPVWISHPHKRREDDGVRDFWKDVLWSRRAANVMPSALANAFQGEPQIAGQQPYSDDEASVRYVVARGLCGYHGPHQKNLQGQTGTSIAKTVVTRALGNDPEPSDAAMPPRTMVYAFPTGQYPLTIDDNFVTPEDRNAPPARTSTNRRRTASNRAQVMPVQDFVLHDNMWSYDLEGHVLPPTTTPEAPYREDAHMVKWAPATRFDDATQDNNFQARLAAKDMHGSEGVASGRCLADAAVREALVDHYARAAVKTGDESVQAVQREDALALRAATKIRQLKSLAIICKSVQRASGNSATDYLDFPASPPTGNPPQTRIVQITRPCVRCPDGRVLYPVDAGHGTLEMHNDLLQSFGMSNAKLWLPSAGLYDREDLVDIQRILYAEAELVRIALQEGPYITREDATRGMRSAMIGDRTDLYVAPPLERTAVVPHHDSASAIALRHVPNGSVPNPEYVSVPFLRATFAKGLRCVASFTRVAEELHFLDQQLLKFGKRTPGGSGNPGDPDDDDGGAFGRQDTTSRKRRGAIYNDALREASISGDRLWTFVQQLSGTIAESVENICVIDESALMRQQKEMKDRRRQAANRAADMHLQIVRNVFSAVLRDSGLKMGLESDGSLKVLNSTLRKQAQELTTRPPGEVGFFTNAVDLEHLLTQGTGDMNLSQLLAQLQKIGKALQDATEASMPSDGSGESASLEFLRAPRNCLFIQWKDEAKAAIRRAYDLFTREMQHHYHGMRTITAFELIEGVDSALCNYFAEFCAHVLASNRMHNPSNAVYVSQQAAATSGRKCGIALARLVNAACNYTRCYAPPGPNRNAYFDQGGCGYNGMAVVASRPELPRMRGGWSVNMYGSF